MTMAFEGENPLFQYLMLSFLCLSTLFFATSKSQEIRTDPSYYYNLCAPSTCNNLTNFSYPFAPPRFCHHPNLRPSCVNNEYLLLSSLQPSDSFRVVSNFTSDSTSDTFSVASNALFSCGSVSKPNYVVDPNVFSLSNNYTYGTHLNCTRRPSTDKVLMPVSCLGCQGDVDNNVCYYLPAFFSFPECESFYVFTPEGFNLSAEKNLRGYLQKGFKIRYTKQMECRDCQLSGGRCGASPDGSFACFCPSSVHRLNCSDGVIEDLKTWIPAVGSSRSSKTLVIALSTSASVVALIALATLVVIFVFVRKSRREKDNESGIQDKDVAQTDMKDLVSGISPTRYSYSQIKKFTTNFTTKLGEGGFGTVYKGFIQGGRSDVPVAIKFLKRSKQSEKQFMNEVATIGRIHHHNLARLLGYCVQGKKRALVYEFMEKGSLDQYIYKNKKEGNEVEWLTPEQLYNVALETARGVLYLHQGCRSRILHCDIKPHNVLLDSNFSAKLSDFGLARMMDKDHSHVSLTAARGTPGYAAPEMWSKSYGPVTEKSDVYSYGMLLLEMAGGRKNYDMDVSASSQVYFPEWAFKKAAQGELKAENGGPHPIEIAEDEMGSEQVDVFKKMCLVGLWCIQHIPSNRPSMGRVIQMLEGNAEIPTPPRPFPGESGETHTDYFTISTVYLSARDEHIENPSVE